MEEIKEDFRTKHVRRSIAYLLTIFVPNDGVDAPYILYISVSNDIIPLENINSIRLYHPTAQRKGKAYLDIEMKNGDIFTSILKIEIYNILNNRKLGNQIGITNALMWSDEKNIYKFVSVPILTVI